MNTNDNFFVQNCHQFVSEKIDANVKFDWNIIKMKKSIIETTSVSLHLGIPWFCVRRVMIAVRRFSAGPGFVVTRQSRPELPTLSASKTDCRNLKCLLARGQCNLVGLNKIIYRPFFAVAKGRRSVSSRQRNMHWNKTGRQRY